MPKITRMDLNKKYGHKAMITKPERELPKGSKSLFYFGNKQFLNILLILGTGIWGF